MKLILNERLGSLGKKISPRAAAGAIALVLLASVVIGRETPSSKEDAEPVEATAPRAQRPGPASPGLAELDVEKMRRPSHDHAPGELFAARVSAVPAPAVVQQTAGTAPPPVPSAPALPFRYLGKLVEGGKLRVFLGNGDALHTVQSGETIENLYKVELVTEEMVTFTYIPLATRQTLAIAAPS